MQEVSAQQDSPLKPADAIPKRQSTSTVPERQSIAGAGIQLAILQQRLSTKAEASEMEDIRRLLSALKAQVAALQTTLEEAAAAPEQAPLRMSSKGMAARKSSARLSMTRLSQVQAQLAAGQAQVPASPAGQIQPQQPASRRGSQLASAAEPHAVRGADAPPLQPLLSQAQQHPDRGVAAPPASLHRISIANGIASIGNGGSPAPGWHVLESPSAEGMPQIRLPPAATASSSASPGNAADMAVQGTAALVSQAAVQVQLEAMQEDMQGALGVMEQGLSRLQDEVDDMALRGEADRTLLATLEQQLQRAQQQMVFMSAARGSISSAGMVSSDTSADWAVSANTPAVPQQGQEQQELLRGGSKGHGFAPTFSSEWMGAASDVADERSMRSVRKALAVITNASHMMAVGTPLQALAKVSAVPCNVPFPASMHGSRARPCYTTIMPSVWMTGECWRRFSGARGGWAAAGIG